MHCVKEGGKTPKGEKKWKKIKRKRNAHGEKKTKNRYSAPSKTFQLIKELGGRAKKRQKIPPERRKK